MTLLPFDILINQGMSNIMEFKRLKYKYPENISTLNPLTIKLMERSLFMHADYWLAQGWWLWIQWMCSNPLSFQVVKGRTNCWKSRLISMWHLLGGGTKKFLVEEHWWLLWSFSPPESNLSNSHPTTMGIYYAFLKHTLCIIKGYNVLC